MSKEDSRDSLLHDTSFQDDLRTALKRAQSQRDDHLQQRTPRGADIAVIVVRKISTITASPAEKTQTGGELYEDHTCMKMGDHNRQTNVRSILAMHHVNMTHLYYIHKHVNMQHAQIHAYAMKT